MPEVAAAAAKNSLEEAGEDSEPIVARLPVTAISDRIAVMRIQEETNYRCRDYFLDPLGHEHALGDGGDGDDMDLDDASGPQHHHHHTQPRPVDADCRTKMAEWCAQVIDFCKFSRETVGIGMSYLDRFMATGARRAREAMADRKDYQLAAMTTLYMAIKINEPLEMETKLLSDLSRGCYTSVEIATMEIDILGALGWRVAGPTPLAFVQHFLAVGLHDTEAAANPALEATLLDFSRFQTELAIGIPALLSVSPSRIALAAILNSMEAIDDVAMNPFERISFYRAIEATSGIDPSAKELLPIRSLLMDSFVRNSGVDFKQVATQLGLGAQRQRATKSCSLSGSEGSDVEVSPVCVSQTGANGMKKQRCA
mmetsp:Transcript_9269/g.19742  ORF Transcript_9269/g.19742 Transcript_9269/m.19742 type:complete len:369 (+) Transcript_9269:258-1364(+)